MQNKTYAEELLEKENAFLKQWLSYSTKHEKNLHDTLKQIASAKTYKFWQKASKLKHGLSLLINPQTMKYTLEYIKDRILGQGKGDIRVVELTKHEKDYIQILPALPNNKVFSSVSIVIPTYNGEEELPRLFKAIQSQNRIIDPEIIIIDSESTDKTKDVAKQHGATFISIKKEDFDHGETRNRAAKEAKGKYIIFTVQDELPLNRNTFADLLTVLTSSEEVVAASTRQIPFPDADMFAKWQILNHISALRLNDINFSVSYKSSTDFFKQPFILKRKLALLDDVCCAVKKKEFSLLGGYRKTDFAEDVDLAIRILTNGFSLGFLGTNGVIHSHTRPTTYFLNRSFADVNTLHTMFQEEVPSIFSSLDELMSVASHLYKNYLSDSPKDPLSLYFQKIIEKLQLKILKESDVVQAEEVYWELFTNIQNQAYTLFKEDEIVEEDKKLFSQKLFSSLIGSQIALFLIDPGTQKNEILTKKVHTLLLDNV